MVDDARCMLDSIERPERFASVYRRHASSVLRYLRARLDLDTAEDAAHEVFLRAFRQRAKYQARTPTALPWLYGIASNVIAEHHRQEARHLTALERSVATSARYENVETSVALSPGVVGALRELTLLERETLLLNVWGELSYDEIAVALGVPIGTVRSRLHRARARLRASLPQDGPRPQTLTGETHA